MTLQNTRVVGNDYKSDDSFGFKDEVKQVMESYNAKGINVPNDLASIIASPTQKESFMGQVCESLTNDAVFTSGACANEPFYDNYGERFEQLLDNSLLSIARESAMIGYAPIVSYAPFFLKKQWVACVFKDIVMTEVPSSPIINIGYEKRYLKDLAGNLYPIPETNYDDTLMAQLTAKATGLAFDEAKACSVPMKAVDVLTADYIPGLTAVTDRMETLTADLIIYKVDMVDTQSTPGTHSVPVNIRVDMTTHAWTKGKVSYKVYSGDGKTLLETLNDEIVGNVDFDGGKVTVMTTGSSITKVYFRGHTANRWNERSLDVVRRNEQLQYTMPESGPRFNSAITIEDAADALVLQNIDIIADNVDVMGRQLADFEDFEIRNFLKNSFDAQEAAQSGPHGYEKLTVSGQFDALPPDTFAQNVTQWMEDSREWFERIIAGLKTKLKTQDAIVIAVAHPNVIRFLQNGINWVFSNETQISGMKLSYNFGIYTSAQDRVHVITSMYMKEDDGIRFIVIPLTKELITYKHYKYTAVIDRGYRNMLHSLTPNVMVTHRTLTFEVLPVQGKLAIKSRDLFSPTTYKRA